jgi:esterase FrsA
MSYTFPVDATTVWSERAPQFVNTGMPKDEVDRLGEVVVDMWIDGPGGWCHEWSRIADRYARNHQPQLAALAYGCARFPCLADRARVTAYQHQIEQYTLAAEDFPVTFDRRIVTTHLHGDVVEVPVHVLGGREATDATPVLLASGGIDGWKMDLHELWVSHVLAAGVRVVAFDIPGTGELSHIALTPGSSQIVEGLVTFARTLTTGKVGHLGLSFGGWFAAHSGLTRAVDAAVVVGGPVSCAFSRENLHALMYGMRDIFGNACGFTTTPTDEQLLSAGSAFTSDDLRAAGTNSPMLVINGDADVHVPLADTKIFEGRPATDVQLIPGGTHCAVNKLDELLAAVNPWLAATLQ